MQARNSQIEENARRSPPEPDEHAFHVREIRLLQLRARPVGAESLLCDFERGAVPVETDEPRSGKTFEQRFGVSPRSDGPVEIETVRIGHPVGQSLLAEDGLVTPG